MLFGVLTSVSMFSHMLNPACLLTISVGAAPGPRRGPLHCGLQGYGNSSYTSERNNTGTHLFRAEIVIAILAGVENKLMSVGGDTLCRRQYI
jgi:hypothetical protein